MADTKGTLSGQYPRLCIDLGTIEANFRAIGVLCSPHGIALTGVVKGAGGMIPVAAAMVKGGCSTLASSRLAQLEILKDATRDLSSGLHPSLSLGLLRVPAPSEIDDVVAIADWSLQSDPCALEQTAQAARRAGKRHGVVLMRDLGDLREGWFDEEQLIAQAVGVERDMPSLHLRGIGTNLSCYGSILPSPDNLGSLIKTARSIESRIGRQLEVVSGGATTSLPLLLRGTMPLGISELRIGEAGLCARDMSHFYGLAIPGVREDAFTLTAELVEIRRKPSVPIGERLVDAFGNHPEYEQRGTRTRLLLAVGKRDFGNHEHLLPRDPRVRVIGSSSDHLICELDDSVSDIEYGSLLDFDLLYGAMLFLSDHNPYVKIEYR
ncbi:MAG: alanine racemase [Spirochaetia bacterium]|jgi:predicted amino acid racemase|nr:alanine racemase [Spirochaetia bacterium]